MGEFSSNFGAMNSKYTLLVALIGLFLLAIVDAGCKDKSSKCLQVKEKPWLCEMGSVKDLCKKTCNLCDCRDKRPNYCLKVIKKRPLACMEDFSYLWKDYCKKTCNSC